jgi:hypothetical protein
MGSLGHTGLGSSSLVAHVLPYPPPPPRNQLCTRSCSNKHTHRLHHWRSTCYLCDSETTLDKVSKCIGSGPRNTLAGDANADIMKTIIECVRERVLRGACTFMVKVQKQRGEPLNERADTQAGSARQLPPESRPWTIRTPRMTYEWQDEGVKRVSTWSKAVRNAMLKGGAELQGQKALNRVAENWNKEFLRTTDKGVARIRPLK